MPLQNPKLVDKPPTGANWRHEIKFDGYRMQLQVEGGVGRWFSRNGFDWTSRMEDFAEDIEALPDGVYDGEVIARDEHGHPDFSALRSFMGSRQRGNMVGDLAFVIFDILADSSGDLRSRPLRERKARPVRRPFRHRQPPPSTGHVSPRRWRSANQSRLPDEPGGDRLEGSGCALRGR